jgi:hypothetical protein
VGVKESLKNWLLFGVGESDKHVILGVAESLKNWLL